MRNLLIALFCVLFAVSAFAADVVAPDAAPVAGSEFNGIIEVTPADTDAGMTEPTIILDMGENTYKLIAADAEKLAELVALEGKALAITGELVAATEGDTMDSIKVESWVETEAVVSDEPVDEEIVDEAVVDEAVEDDAPDAE